MKKHLILLAVTAVVLVSCTDPIKSSFIQMCTAHGDPMYRCTCLHDNIEKDIGKMDPQFVQLVADFASWSVPKGGRALTKQEMMEKYSLSEDDYRAVVEKLGGVFVKTFKQCG